MNAEADQPEALRGPLGLRTLPFSRNTTPLVARFAHKKRVLIGAVLLGLLPFPWLFLIINDMRKASFSSEDDLMILTVVFWILSDVFFTVVAALGAGFAVRSWRSKRRLPEIFLTPIRPITLGQIMLTRLIRPLLVFSFFLHAGIAYALIAQDSRFWGFIVPVAVLALNSAVTVYTTAWIHLPICLAHDDVLRVFWNSMMFHITFILSLVPAVLLIAAVWMFGFIVLDWDGGVHSSYFNIAFPFMALFLWTPRLLFARAFAARFEQVVYPRMEF